jgi:uncharacterized protein with HEPN domain
MERNIIVYIQNILKAIEPIEKFVKDIDFEQFRSDDKTSSTVIRKFEIICEAARNIPKSFRQKYPNIPWKEMVGFRDKLIHFYFGIKYEIVWDTIKTKLPELKLKLYKI